jgi:hypothetical protein
MPSKDLKVSFLLNGGIDNRSMDELVAPLVKQGDSPTLKKSTNTRLGVTPGGVVRSPAATAISGAPTVPDRARAIVSSASGRNTLVVAGPDLLGLPKFIPDAGRAGLSAGFIGAQQDRSYQHGVLTAQVLGSESVGSAKAVSQFAVSYNASSNRVWFAWLSNNGYTQSPTIMDMVMVGTLAPDGTIAATPIFATQLTSPASRWIGMTSHGANGDRVWYVSDAGNICYRTVTLSGGGILQGSEVAVVSPGSLTTGIDVCRLDDTFAILVASRVVTPADGAVTRVNITNNAQITTNIVNALNGGGDCAVAVASPEGTVRIAVVFSSVTAVTATLRVYDSALSLVSTSGAKACHGRVAVGFSHNDTASSGGIVPHVSMAVERHITPYPALAVRSEPTITHYLIRVSDGVDGSSEQIPWYRIAGRAAQWITSNQLICTIHQFVPRNALADESPGAANFVDDPSLDLFWCRTDGQFAPLTCIARLGVVRGTSSPVDHLYTGLLSSSSLMCVGDDLHSVYRLLTDFSAVASTATRGRHSLVRLSAPTGQPSTAQDRDGTGLLAAAVPLQWDGQNVAEVGAPVHTPQLYADLVTAGAGTILPAGTYSYQAVIFWTDASGLVHRSRPSKLRTVTTNGTTHRVSLCVGHVVTMIPSAFEARIYATEMGGKTLHLMAVLPVRVAFPWFHTTAVAVTTANAQIFSGGGNGEEIVPQPPPPAWDISVIGGRCWIVDAEVRSRSVYSKLRIAGVGYEFSPGFEVILPSGAGAIMANREWQGLTVILTERAVYQVAGDGPSNTLGGGGAFSAPVKIADIGCSNTSSIVVCPTGIIWQFGTRLVMLDGSGVHYIASFQATHDVSAALCWPRFAEVLFFSLTTPEIRSYNYESGRWTTWDAQTLPELVRAAHVLPYDQDCAVLALGEGPTTFKRIEANTVGAATNMVWETDWLLLGGDFQDCVLLRDVVFNGRIAGAHNIRIELFTDYATVAGTDRSWSNAQLDAIDVNGYYTVRLEPRELDCRAVKVRVTDTLVSGAGCSPRSLTIVYAIDAMLREEAFVTGSRQ